MTTSESKLSRDITSAGLLVPVLLVGSMLAEWAWARATGQVLTTRFNIVATGFAFLFAATIPFALLYLHSVLRPRGPKYAIVIGVMTAAVSVVPFANDILQRVAHIELAAAFGLEVVAASVALHYLRTGVADPIRGMRDLFADDEPETSVSMS
ncbi:MAG TPA: hypothetical protein VH559_05170 [Gemmatimonadaceae bacterium]|jgi:hypothetical protein